MEQKSNRPVDWEAFVLRYEAKLTAPRLPFWAAPRKRKMQYKTRSSSTWKRPPFFSTRRRRRPG